ncbi:MAG: DUF5615 family PIN-like protein [Pseudonocardiaceae bacterium]
MLSLAADENFNNAIVRGIVRRNSAIDIVRVQDVGLCGADDPAVLEWAANDGGGSTIQAEVDDIARKLDLTG